MAFKTSAALWYAKRQDLEPYAYAAKSELKMGQDALADTLSRAPDDLRSSLMLARLYQVESRLFRASALQDARKVLEGAIRVHPNNPLPLWAMASVSLEEGDAGKASDFAAGAFDLNPLDPDAHTARLMVAAFTGDTERIADMVKESSEQFPNMRKKFTSLTTIDPTQYLFVMDELY